MRPNCTVLRTPKFNFSKTLLGREEFRAERKVDVIGVDVVVVTIGATLHFFVVDVLAMSL